MTRMIRIIRMIRATRVTRTHRAPFAAASLLIVGVLAGCSQTTTVVAGDPTAGGRPETAVIRHAGLSLNIAVEAVQQFERGGQLVAQVTVRNSGGRQETFRYRFEFFDGGGLQVDPASGVWKERTLQAGETAVLAQVAGSSRAADFRLSMSPWQ